MNPPLECRTWDGEKMRYLTTAIVAGYSIGFCEEDEHYVDISLDMDHEKNVEVMWSTGHQTIDDQKVFAGDLLRFGATGYVCEVRWDNDEGAWGIFYKDMNCFKIGMTRFTVVAGNIFEGVKEKV